MITLYNVIDIRTGKHHSVANISKRLERFFISAEDLYRY